MKCPFCNSNELKVVETRESVDNLTRRRKECFSCNKRFTTYEKIDLGNIFVVKKDGTKQEFKEQKIKGSIIRAYDKRNFPEDKVEKISRDIISKLYSLGQKEVLSTQIGRMILSKLKTLDKLAYLRFSYVFNDFQDIENIKEVIKKIEK